MSLSRRSSPLPSCFRPSTPTHHLPPPPPPPPPMSGHPNITTCLYHTHVALFSLTWSRSLLSRSLLVHLLPNPLPFESPQLPSLSSSSPSFHLHIKPFLFWKKHGSKKLAPNFKIFWDFTRAKFGSGPEPHSGFYIAVLVDHQMTLLVGDLVKEANVRTKALKGGQNPQALVLKREHVVARKIYATKARFGGKVREIQIDCGNNDDSRLCFSVDNKRVLQIKRLKWKFRGNERIEVDGVPVQISWDVYNWIFDDDKDNGHAVFMFRFEEEEESRKNGAVLWTQQQNWNIGMNGIELRKMRKSLSSSSISMSSSAGSSGSSSVMEWASMEESELSGGPSGFSLLVYAWKR